MKPNLKKKLIASEVEASLQHEFVICWIRNNRDTSPRPETVSLARLGERFRVPALDRGRLSLDEYLALDKGSPDQKRVRDAEKNGEAFIPAEFAQAHVRSDAAVVRIYCFVLDFDGGVTKAEIEERLADVAYVAYTSYSHHSGEDRWRVVIPYRAPCLPDQHAAVYEYFKKSFNGRLDARSATKSQLWYTPACPYDAADHYELLVHAGRLFDPYGVESVPSAIASKSLIVKQTRSPDSPTVGGGTSATARDETHEPIPAEQLENLVDALSYVSADDRSVWIRVGMALKHEYGDAGRDVWIVWSRNSDKFDEADAHYNWNSFKGREAGVTLGTVLFLAQQGGWKPGNNSTAGHMAVAELNRSHFISRESGKTIVFREVCNAADNSIRLQRLATRDVIDFFRNRMVKVGKKSVDLGNYWLGHPDRRQYSDVIFSPNVDVPGTYNLWRGFAIRPIQGDWSLMKRHILEVICGGNQQQYDYFIGWMAYAVQYPERPAEVALVLRGLQGTGKGVVVRAFGRLFGQHFLQISQTRHLTGHFNAHLSDCVVLFVDEAFWAGDKQGEGALKALITEPRLVIEPKGVNAYSVENRLHLVIASNSDWVIPAGNMERRYCVLDVADTHIQDAPYFTALNAETESGGLAAMLHDLLDYDLSSFNVRKPPYTDGLRTQMLQTLSPQQQWWMEELQSADIWKPRLTSAVKGTAAIDPGPDSIDRSHLQQKYADGCHGLHASRSSETQLGIFLKTVLPKGWPKELRMPKDGTTTRRYGFPSLAECRLHFERLTGLKGIFEVGAEGAADNLHNLANLKPKFRKGRSA